MNFQLNLNSIEKFANDLKKESGNLVEIIDYLIRITYDTDTFFDTPSAKIMSEGLLDYLKKSRITCANLEKVANKVKLFNRSYSNLYDSTKRSVGDEL